MFNYTEGEAACTKEYCNAYANESLRCATMTGETSGSGTDVGQGDITNYRGEKYIANNITRRCENPLDVPHLIYT